MTAQAKTCVANVQKLLKGLPLLEHVDKEKPPPVPMPMNIKVGHGPNGWLYWNQKSIPGPVAFLCCMPCGGGFPFCPLPCFWCCVPGCARLCGNCGGPPASSSASAMMEESLLPMFAAAHAHKGITGKPKAMAPPSSQQAFN